MSSETVPRKRTLLGKYELERFLGQGGFAKVYMAREIRTGLSVAVKVVSRERVEKDGLASSVKREVTIMQQLRHPHIIRIYEVLATKTKVYFILELAKGGELFSKVVGRRFSENLSRRYFQQLISAVAHCHARGVYHRDLKLENLLLDENFDLKVTDFGLSALKSMVNNNTTSSNNSENNGGNNNNIVNKNENNERARMLHTVCGTPNYVAPEILGKRGYFGDKVDVWSCGVVLFALTAGRFPFDDTNMMRLRRQICKGEFRCPTWMSGDLKHLLKRLLDVNPATRITVKEIINDPWFAKGYKVINPIFYDDHLISQDDGGGDDENNNNEGNNPRFLNAFDLISFLPGFSLLGLSIGYKVNNRRETFISKEDGKNVVQRIKEVSLAIREPKVVLQIVKGGMGLRLEGQNGNFGLVVEVHRLTTDLVVVEVRWREKEVGPGQGYWKEKVKPQICDLIYDHSIQINNNGMS